MVLGAVAMCAVFALSIQAAAAPSATRVDVCGTFKEYQAAANGQPGRITVGSETFALSPRAFLQDRPAVVEPGATIGSQVCLSSEWVAAVTLGRTLEAYRVRPAGPTDQLPSTATVRTDAAPENAAGSAPTPAGTTFLAVVLTVVVALLGAGGVRLTRRA